MTTARGAFVPRAEEELAEGLRLPPSEVAAVAARRSATNLSREAATEAAFRGALPDVDWVHVAAHGELDPRWLGASRLALSPSEGYDGWLHAFELGELRLNGCQVVPSACRSAGPPGGVAGVSGLPRAFLDAGARSVLANRWPADDEAAAFLFLRYYGALDDGIGPIEALRRAQVACIREGGRGGLAYAHPFFWAGLVHHGAR